MTHHGNLRYIEVRLYLSKLILDEGNKIIIVVENVAFLKLFTHDSWRHYLFYPIRCLVVMASTLITQLRNWWEMQRSTRSVYIKDFIFTHSQSSISTIESKRIESTKVEQVTTIVSTLFFMTTMSEPWFNYKSNTCKRYELFPTVESPCSLL